MVNQTDIKRIFSENLNTALQEKKLTQAQLAQKADTSPQNISKYCKGNALPDLGIVAQIAEALNVSVDWLLGLGYSNVVQHQKAAKLSEYLRNLVTIADTLNFRVKQHGAYYCLEFVDLDLDSPDPTASAEIDGFLRSWKTYRDLLEEHVRDLSYEDYSGLIESRLGRLYNNPEIEESHHIRSFLKK